MSKLPHIVPLSETSASSRYDAFWVCARRYVTMWIGCVIPPFSRHVSPDPTQASRSRAVSSAEMLSAGPIGSAGEWSATAGVSGELRMGE